MCGTPREVLNRGSMLERVDGGRAFAFKLHQFIGQGRALFATLGYQTGVNSRWKARYRRVVDACLPPSSSAVSAARTTTTCWSDGRFLPHPVGTESTDDESHPGYLMLAPTDNDWSEAHSRRMARSARALEADVA